MDFVPFLFLDIPLNPPASRRGDFPGFLFSKGDVKFTPILPQISLPQPKILYHLPRNDHIRRTAFAAQNVPLLQLAGLRRLPVGGTSDNDASEQFVQIDFVCVFVRAVAADFDGVWHGLGLLFFVECGPAKTHWR
ncbi:MAG: hypothetical protein SCK70_16540 [bacterium]|nr:hypothetical protein [bacterium]